MTTNWVEVFRLLDEMEKCVERVKTLRIRFEIGYGEG